MKLESVRRAIGVSVRLAAAGLDRLAAAVVWLSCFTLRLTSWSWNYRLYTIHQHAHFYWANRADVNPKSLGFFRTNKHMLPFFLPSFWAAVERKKKKKKMQRASSQHRIHTHIELCLLLHLRTAISYTICICCKEKESTGWSRFLFFILLFSHTISPNLLLLSFFLPEDREMEKSRQKSSLELTDARQFDFTRGVK